MPGAIETGTYPFINFVKMMNGYTATDSTWPSLVNADNYLQSPPPATVASAVRLPADYTGTWWIRWTGDLGSTGAGLWILAGSTSFTIESDGATEAAFVAAKTGGALKLKGTNGAVEFRFPTGTLEPALWFVNAASGSALSGLTNLELIRDDQLALYDVGEIFNPDYIAFSKSNRSAVKRQLGWNEVHKNLRSRLAHFPTVNCITYCGNQWVPGLWGGTASFAGNTYSVSAPPDWDGLADGAAVQFFLNDTSSASPLLNVGGTGAYDLRDEYGNTDQGVMSGPRIVTAVFDSKLFGGGWIVTPMSGFNPVAPYEVFIDYCNKIKSHCWVLAPHLFDDDSFEALGELARDRLHSSLQFIPEYSNEVGNYTFIPTGWARYRGLAMGFPGSVDGEDAIHQVYGWRTAAMLKRMKNIWTENGRSLSTLCGVSTALRFGAALEDRNVSRLDGALLTLDADGDYTAGTPVTDYSQSPNRPKDLLTYSSFATYFSGPNIMEYPNGGSQSATNSGWCSPLQSAKTVTAFTSASTGVVTITAHGYTNGDRVYVTAPGKGSWNGCYTTVTNKTNDTFELSTDTTDVSGTVIGKDTSAAGALSSNGAAQRITPTVNDDLLAIIDDHHAGNTEAAFDAIDADIKSGTRINTAGSPQAGESTVDYHFNSTAGLIGFDDWVDLVSASDARNLPYIGYEGAICPDTVAAYTCRKLGISEDYAMKYNRMITAWRASSHASDMVDYFLGLFHALDPSLKWSGWSKDIANYSIGTINAEAAGTTTLTVNSVASGSLRPGFVFRNVNIPPTTYVVRQLTGTVEGAGTYELSAALTLSAQDVKVFGPSLWGNILGELGGTEQQTMAALRAFSIS